MLVAVVGSACGVGDKQRRAEVIYDAHAKAKRSGFATGTLAVTVVPVRRPGVGPTTIPGAPALPAQAPRSTEAQVLFGFEGERVQLAAAPAPDAAPEPRMVFQGDTVFVRRTNARASERRLWARLDFGSLTDREPRPDEVEGDGALHAAVATMNPIHIVDLALGTLAGSVKVVGKEEVGGVATTRYRANVSFERSMTELDLEDDQWLTRVRAMRLLGVGTDVVPAGFWIDDEGRLRRVRVALPQRLSRTEVNAIIMRLDIAEYGSPGIIASPTRDETIEVERYGRLLRTSQPNQA